MHHPPDVQREVIAEYKRCAGRVAWSDPDRDTFDSPLRRSSSASRGPRRGLFTVLILVGCFMSSIVFNAVVQMPNFDVRLARTSMPMRLAGKFFSTGTTTAMIIPRIASPDKRNMAIDPATARKPSNVKVVSSGCDLAKLSASIRICHLPCPASKHHISHSLTPMLLHRCMTRRLASWTVRPRPQTIICRSTGPSRWQTRTRISCPLLPTTSHGSWLCLEGDASRERSCGSHFSLALMQYSP